jgi:3-deoxy-D-manno-octulosonic-acid transferase
VYTLIIRLYGLVVWLLAQLGHRRANAWVQGRVAQRETGLARLQALRATWSTDAPVLWLHCASLGEFEQGRPVLEAWRESHPQGKVVLTFFSPSGYEIRKNTPLADWVGYLPLDVPKQVEELVSLVEPTLVVVIKYEIWKNWIESLNRRNVSVYLVGAYFRKESVWCRYPFLRHWYARTLGLFTGISVLDETSYQLAINTFGLQKVIVSGDPRLDRVIKISEQPTDLATVQAWIGNRKCAIIGSSWPPDEAFIEQVIRHFIADKAVNRLAWIFAPHQTDEYHINQLEKRFGYLKTIRYSQWLANTALHSAHSEFYQILIIDQIGLLAQLYRLADWVWVGGGFGVSVHNTLEPAVYGLKVLYGPHCNRFPETADMQRLGAARVLTNPAQAIEQVQLMLDNTPAWQAGCLAARNYVWKNRGATQRILDFLSDN